MVYSYISYSELICMSKIHQTYEITYSAIFLPKGSLPRVYRMLILVYSSYVNATANMYTDDDGMHKLIALAQLC